MWHVLWWWCAILFKCTPLQVLPVMPGGQKPLCCFVSFIPVIVHVLRCSSDASTYHPHRLHQYLNDYPLSQLATGTTDQNINVTGRVQVNCAGGSQLPLRQSYWPPLVTTVKKEGLDSYMPCGAMAHTLKLDTLCRTPVRGPGRGLFIWCCVVDESMQAWKIMHWHHVTLHAKMIGDHSCISSYISSILAFILFTLYLSAGGPCTALHSFVSLWHALYLLYNSGTANHSWNNLCHGMGSRRAGRIHNVSQLPKIPTYSSNFKF